MSISIREARSEDIPSCGAVMYEAFKGIAEQHNFPPDFPSAEAAAGLLNMAMDDPGFDAAVAEDESANLVASIFVSKRSEVGGISIITVNPEAQNGGVGRELMRHGMALLEEQGHHRQQLIQAAYHNRSLCLYAKLGFAASEILSNMGGKLHANEIPGRSVRPASSSDADACNELCQNVHGFTRVGEVASAIAQGTASVVENDGRITGYTTGVGFIGHGVGKSNDDLKALIASADEFSGPGILIPTGNNELFRWGLDNGLRVSQQLILMDTDPSGPPNGVYWPSVLC